jgi:predicted dinucleotide-binding enzyme
MRIGIIGAGRVGATLARHLAYAGHEIAIANSRDPETLAVLARLLGGLVQPRTVCAAAEFADLAVVAIPFARHRELPVTELAGKPVIDVTNYDPARDGCLRAIEDDHVTSSELLQEHLAEAQVVKAFNAIPWDRLRDEAFRDRFTGRHAIPVSGDHVMAKKAALALVDEIGFDPVDVGGLASGGRKHQPGTVVFGLDLTAAGLRARLRLPT